MNKLIELLPKRIYIVGYILQDTYKDEPDDVIVKIYDDFTVANEHYMYLKEHVAFNKRYEEIEGTDDDVLSLAPYLQTRFIGSKFNPSVEYPKILLQLYAVQFVDWWTQPVEEYDAYWNISYYAAFDFLYDYFSKVDEQDVHPDIVNWLKSNPY